MTVFGSLLACIGSPQALECAGIFVDAGGNKGDTLQSWYNDESCSTSPHKLLPKGTPCAWQWPWWLPLRYRRQWCADVFEANPEFSSRLVHLGERLQDRFRRKIYIHARTAFSTNNGSAIFGIDTGRGTGSSLVLERRALDLEGRKGLGPRVGDNAVLVSTVDATAYLGFLGKRGVPIALKLDVEGSEYEILRDVVMTGVLCRYVGTLWVEFHSIPEDASSGIPSRAGDVFKWMLESHNASNLRHQIQKAWLPYGGERCVTTLLPWA